MTHSFASLGLSAPLQQALDEQGYREPTPIQSKAIPMILTGRDMMAAAQTGTGKTAGFTLPLLQRLSDMKASKSGAPRALILVPTRELADQVGKSVEAYGRHLPFKSAIIIGGVDVEPQLQQLQQGVDIVIATPGRLKDLLNQKKLSLQQLRMLVLDEADRMLDLGFIQEIRSIISLLPQKRQSLMFSATFSPDIVALTEELMRHPVRVEVAPRNSAAKTVKQTVYAVDVQDKPDILSYIIQGGKWSRALVFVRTKKRADQLVEQLAEEQLSAVAIHSNKSQIYRTRALDALKKGKVRILVATDVAARGLDIEQLPLVVNYDLPKVAQDYVHRIGRTGRAGESGRAISLMSPEERKLVGAIGELLGRKLAPEPLPFFEDGVLDTATFETPVKKTLKVRKQTTSQKKGGGSNPAKQPRKGQGSNHRSARNSNKAGTAKTDSKNKRPAAAKKVGGFGAKPRVRRQSS
ncbi:DEAD/DEAH box helicase [Spongorhabdus nitratireducens]